MLLFLLPHHAPAHSCPWHRNAGAQAADCAPQGLLNYAANLYTAAKTYPGSYSARIRGSVCTTQYERSSIGPTGTILATSGVCKGPYDALNGSALVWCVPACLIECKATTLAVAALQPVLQSPAAALWPCTAALDAHPHPSVAAAAFAGLTVVNTLCRYNSTSYYDDMTWAATWMYQATKQATYLNDAISYYVLHSQVRAAPHVTSPRQSPASYLSKSEHFPRQPEQLVS